MGSRRRSSFVYGDLQIVMDLRICGCLLNRYGLPDYEQQAEDFGGLRLVSKCTYLEIEHRKGIYCASQEAVV